ncbi:MAG: right-handed parallel beta-helix repeat-containing protein, partial [bacterium]
MKRQIFASLVVLGFLAFKPIWAETYVYGTITSNTTWALANSPYVATDTVIVANGVILTIEPEVTVKFATETSLICYGTLNAIGNPAGTITFTSSQTTPSAGDWKGIKFSGANAKGTISYCNIGYAKQGVYLENVSGIIIVNNYIHDNKGNDGSGSVYGTIGEIGTGIYLLNSNNVVLLNNTISNNIGGQGGAGGYYVGSGSSGGIGCGIYLSSSTNNTILGNTISQNQGGGGGIGVGGWGGYQPHGKGGSGGISCGIYLSSSTNNTILQNTISQNQGGQGGQAGGVDHGGSGGRGCGIYLLSSTDNIIQENTISLNTGGIGGYAPRGSGGEGGIGCGIYLSQSTDNTISGNTISNNQGGQGGTGVAYGSAGVGYGIYIEPNSLNNTITTSNTYNGEPIHYYYNQSGITIENQNLTLAGSGSTNLGRIVLINCQNFTIRNNTIVGGIGQNGTTGQPGGHGGIGCGIYLSNSTNNTISGNTISNNTGGQGGSGGWSGSGGPGGIGCGVYLSNSTNNTIYSNTISQNQGGMGGTGGYWASGGPGGIGCGIYLSNSSNNTILDNTISNNIGGNRGNPGYGGGYGSYGQGYGIYSTSNSFPEIHCNNLSGNKNGDLTKGFGVWHDGSSGTISATYNWWGANSGPYHGTSNPSGQGDKVSDWVDYWPWTAITLVNPNSGPIGTIVTIEGQGFTTQTQVFIDFGTHPTIAARESSITGTFSITFMVDTQPVCTKVITARNEYGKSATTLFKLMSGILGVSLSKEGPSFALSQSTITYTLYYKNTGTTVLSNVFLKDQLPNGAIQTFSLGLLNPNQEGSKTIKYFIQEQGSSTITNYATITGTSEVSCAEGVVTAYSSCSTHITFIPEITNLTPTSGPIGTIITIQGQNFATNSLISIDFGTHLT